MLISVVAYPFQHESVSRTVQEVSSHFTRQETEMDCQRFRPGSWAAKPVLGFPEWPTSDSPRGFTAGLPAFCSISR